MEHFLFNRKEDGFKVIHRCFKDSNNNVYTQEGCNYDDMNYTSIEPITLRTMINITNSVDGGTAIMCANCFPIEGL